MAVQILQTRQEVDRARAELVRRGLDARTSLLHNILHRLRLVRGARVGDTLKSWDVLQTVELLEASLDQDEAILDLGAYGSEILPILRSLGFTRLTGIDLDPRIVAMPHADDIRLLVGDYLESGLDAGSFSAISAISVIEHGFQPEPLLREVSRLLAPGGLFVASTDYWPEKISTEGQRLFGLDWCIFSRPELEGWIASAADHDLSPIAELELEAREPAIRWAGRDYTFAWIALRKKP